MLTSFASRGHGLNREVNVGSESLRQGRFHFFLDGLDEAPLAEQEALAERIVQLAKAFPQHRFTVATRHVEAVTAFPRDDAETATPGEWRVLEVAPDRDWQQRYLTSAGVRLSDLEEEMPALRDLTELLQLPFFLHHTIELHRAGRLRDFRDLFGVVQELVALALDRETEVRLPGEAARTWLRSLALAMHLAGRTSLSAEELRRVPLPLEIEEVIGSTAAVAETLVARLLLRERVGEYSFGHRILGEALAAEALDRVRPEVELLDAIAPIVAAGVSGVRRDWAVPMTFLMGRNDEWRTAIAGRDPLAAARSVPITAPARERRAAAGTIWERYVQLGIWMWDFGVRDLLNDAAALGRLLAAGEADDLIAEIKGRIDDDSPEVQGNAIRALGFAHADGLAEDLGRVLGDDERSSVVRRHAAVGARQIGAHELLPLVVQRALTAGSVEAQDCAICALELAGEDEFVTVAIDLAGNRYARMIAEPRLRRHASGADMMRFLRAYAEHDTQPYDLETSLLEEAVSRVLRDD